MRIVTPSGGDPSLAYWAMVALADHCFEIGVEPRFVLTAPDKRPVHAGWQSDRPDLGQVLDHLRDGGGVGVEPWSLRSAVLDVDRCPARARRMIERAGLRPWATVRTARRYGQHHFVRTPEPEPNGSWRYGDIKGRRGYVVLHDPPALAEAMPKRADAPVAPIQQLRLFGPPTAKVLGIRVANAPEVIPVGNRNDWLYRRLLCAAKGHDLGVMAKVENRRRLSVPLPDAEVAKIVRSATAARRRLEARGLLNAKQVARGRRSGAARWAAAEGRNEAIRAAKQAEPGLSAAALAVRFGCSIRTVWGAIR